MEIYNKFKFGDVFNVLNKMQTQTYTFQRYTFDKEVYTPWTFLISCGGFITFPEPNEHFCTCGFTTERGAERYRQFLIDTNPFANKVAIVTKNTDFIEGRGPNVFHKVFTSPAKAHDYIIKQSGICSSRPQGVPKIEFGITINGELYGSYRYNGYEIILADLQ